MTITQLQDIFNAPVTMTKKADAKETDIKSKNRKSSKLHWKLFGALSLGLLIYMVFPFLDVFIYGIFIYHVARPLYRKFHKRFQNKTIPSFISLFLVVLPILIIAIYTLSVASIELSTLLANIDLAAINIEYINQILNEFNTLAKDITPMELLGLISEHGDFWKIFVAPLSNFITVLFKLFLMFTIAFYLLKDASGFRKWVLNTFLFAEEKMANKLFNVTDAAFHRVFFGSIVTTVLTSIVGVIVFCSLNLIAPQHLAIPYPVLLGILCGIAGLIPAVGIKLVWVPLTIYLGIQGYIHDLLFTEWWFLLMFLIAVNLLVDIIPDLVLRPYISGREIHTGMILFSYIFGSIVFGFVGLFLGPMIVILAINFITIVLPRIRN